MFGYRGGRLMAKRLAASKNHKAWLIAWPQRDGRVGGNP